MTLWPVRAYPFTGRPLCQLLEKGITIDGPELCKPAEVEVLNDHLIHLTITEGKFHQVKKMMEAVGNKVNYLKRIKMGSLSLDENLSLGEIRELTDEEVKLLEKNQLEE